jgi:phage anti-repressor protein
VDFVILLLPVYYRDYDKIILSNWFRVQNNDFSGLYKNGFKFKRIPNKFYKIALDMLFQMEKLDLTTLVKRSELAIMLARVAITQNKSLKFQADVLAKQIAEMNKKDNEGANLNDFINYIETTFNNYGTIDPDKIKAKRAFSLYHLAIEKNKQIKHSLNEHYSK